MDSYTSQNNKRKLLIIGAGQYGAVAGEIARSTGEFDTVEFADDSNPSAIGKISDLGSLAKQFGSFFVAIGNVEVRERFFNEALAKGMEPANIVSPRANLSESAKLCGGVILEPFASVCANAVIERGTLICSGAVVGHDAVVGSFCKINYNAAIPEGSRVPNKRILSCGQVWMHE